MELPHQVGPYRIITALGTETVTADAQRYLALDSRSPGSGAVVLSVPPSRLLGDTAFHVRFRAEGEKSRRITGPAVLPVLDVAQPGDEPPWVTSSYVPAVPLTEALRICSGPLPETTVRVLGSVLAETLSFAHADGLVHAGITPTAVMLATDGPRLLGFGSFRAGGVGDQPFSPPDDVFALGTVLAHAATGHVRPDSSELPGGVRSLIGACLAPDPAQRPQATVLLRELRTAVGQVWLPTPVVSAINEQERQVRAAESELRAGTEALAQAETDISGARASGIPAAKVLSRKALIVGAAAGAVGMAMGGAAAYATSGEDKAARPRPRRTRFPGVAPTPEWRSVLPDEPTVYDPLVWRDRVAVFGTERGAVGIDARTGKGLWEHREGRFDGAPVALRGGLVLLPGRPFNAVSARTGVVEWSADGYGPGSDVEYVSAIGQAGDTFWFTAKSAGGGEGEEMSVVVAYDTASQKERWQTGLPQVPGDAQALLQEDFLLLPGANGQYTALDRRTGKKKWTQKYEGLDNGEGSLCTGTPDDLLVAAKKKQLGVFEMVSGELAWVYNSDHGTLGEAALHKSTLYVTDTHFYTYALDAASGDTRWESDSGIQSRLSEEFPRTTVSHSGRTVVACNAAAVDAYNTKDGKLLWHFTPIGTGEHKGYAGAVVGRTKDTVLVRDERSVYSLPVD